MPAPASHSSQSSGSPELIPSTATITSESQSTIFPDSDFDSSSFDFAMAFAEASYSAQTSEDTPSPALQGNLRPATQLNNSPSGQHDTSPPDLFAPLKYPPLIPPLEQARSQSLRFPEDLYTPQFIRKHGIEREGWCGICRPGRWLVLKNSAFWYDKSFMHGISAASGTRFDEPVKVRRAAGQMDGEGGRRGSWQDDGWEGLCGTCGVWVTLGGGRRGGVPWFRHAYKVRTGSWRTAGCIADVCVQCHTHHKLQVTPRKRRENKGEKGSKTDNE